MTFTQLTAIDLFSGAGGLTCGLKQAGYNVVSAVEVEHNAALAFSMNHPETMLIKSDIRNLSPKEVMNQLGLKEGDLSLLAGCPPCQGFSTLRTRRKAVSHDDDRNDLVLEFLRWAEALLPKVIMVENVPALAKDIRTITLLRKLQEIGYHTDEFSMKVEDISEYGIPQRRKRMIILLSRVGEKLPILPKKELKTVRSALESLPKAGVSGDLLHDLPENRTKKIKKLISLIPKNGGSRSDLPKEYWLECHKKYPTGFRDVYGRMAWDEVSPTITGGCGSPSKGRFLHPEEDRSITLREAAVLQTFPYDYKFPISAGKEKIALMIGNALPPEYIRQQGERIRTHLAENGC